MLISDLWHIRARCAIGHCMFAVVQVGSIILLCMTLYLIGHILQFPCLSGSEIRLSLFRARVRAPIVIVLNNSSGKAK